jgi:copper chaperone
MKTATLQLETISCPTCMQKIEAAIKGLDGVEKDTVKVLFNASKVKLSFDENKTSIEQIENAVTKLGFEVTKTKTN